MRLDYSKACRKLGELLKVPFDHCKVCSFAEVWRVRFSHRKACRRLAELSTVRFDHRKACR